MGSDDRSRGRKPPVIQSNKTRTLFDFFSGSATPTGPSRSSDPEPKSPALSTLESTAQEPGSVASEPTKNSGLLVWSTDDTNEHVKDPSRALPSAGVSRRQQSHPDDAVRIGRDSALETSRPPSARLASGLSDFDSPPARPSLGLIDNDDLRNKADDDLRIEADDDPRNETDDDLRNEADDDNDSPPLPPSRYIAGHVHIGARSDVSLNASFQTTSTLSAPPPSSQVSRSSSRRIVCNGVQLVTNSSPDNSTVELTDGSDSDLEDLDAILAGPKGRQRSPPTRIERTERRQLRSAPSRSIPTSTHESPRKKLKFDFHKIIKSGKQQVHLNARIKALEDSVMKLDKAEDDSPDDSAVVDHGLNDIVAGDADAKFKLKSAMQRADAFHKPIRFHIFDKSADSRRISLWPKDKDKSWSWSWPWTTDLRDSKLNPPPYLLDFVELHGLPETLVPWIIDEALSSEDHVRAHFYLLLLQLDTQKGVAKRDQLTLEQFKAIVTALGVRKDILDLDARKPLKSSRSDAGFKSPDGAQRTRLSNLASLIRVLAGGLDRQTCETCIVVFCLALIDDDLRFDRDVKIPLLDALSELLVAYGKADPNEEQAHSLERASKLILSMLNEVLLSRLLDSLLSPHETVAFFRRQLAFTGTTDEPVRSYRDLTSPDCWSAILLKFRADARFTVTAETNYVALTARVRIVDTAIGAGFIDPRSLLLGSTARADSGSRSGPDVASARAEVKSFDDSVDALVVALRGLGGSIRDAGTAHMQRTECKSTIDGVVARLEYGVRTRPRPGRLVFGSGGGGEGDGRAEREVMARFIGRTGGPI